MNWVMDNHTTSGSKLNILMAIARICHRQTFPFWTYASYDDIARYAGICRRYVIKLVPAMVEERSLKILREGEGGRPHLYDPLPLVVNSRLTLPVNMCSPHQQEWAREIDDLVRESPVIAPFAVPDPAPAIYPKPKQSKL